jgi:hypothetical protein
MKMKISTAMALGRTMILPHVGIHLNGQRTHGCAWGMVNMAAPAVFDNLFGMSRSVIVYVPCECKMGHMGGMVWAQVNRRNNLCLAIVHLFNDHVMTRKDWTMDQLIDWVASVEPPDPEETVVTEDAKERKEVAVCP